MSGARTSGFERPLDYSVQSSYVRLVKYVVYPR